MKERSASAAARLPTRPLIGCIHHASHLKQSPPLDGDAFSVFMRSELAAMRAAGFTSYVLECGWADLEWDRDRFDFDRVDRQLALCRELELVPHLWLFAELTPRWFRAAHPEALCLAASGRPGMTHSIAHPLARERVRAYVDACVRRYGQDVACANVGIESGLWWVKGPDTNDYDDALYDYNPAAVAGWRVWLERRHGSLEAFSRLCRERFPAWEDVQPPTRRPFRSNPMLENQVPWLEWRRYTIDLFTEYIAAKAAAVRAVAPALPVSDQSYAVDPVTGAQDIRAIARQVDVVGTSFFVSNAPGDFPLGNYLLDYHRSAARGKPFWIWELRSGQNAWGITNWGPPVDDADLARFTWQVIGAGAQAICYWNWRPHLGGLEVGGHGMAERDGSANARTRRMGALAARLDEGRSWFMPLRPVAARIAILDAYDARIVASGESSDRLVLEAQQGLHAALSAHGHQIEFVSESEVTEGCLSSYAMLCLPCAYVLSAAAADAIARWVFGGGTLVAGMFCGAKDAFGFAPDAVPGNGLDVVFGAREGTIVPIYDPRDAPVSQFGEAWDVAISGRRDLRWRVPMAGVELPLTAYRYRAALAPRGAQVLAEDVDGAPAVTRHVHGQGTAVLLGTLPVPADPFRLGGLGQLLDQLALAAGIRPPLTLDGCGELPIFARLLTAPDGPALVIVLSASVEPATVTVELPATLAADWAESVETGEPVPIVVDGTGRRLRLTIPGRDAVAVRVGVRFGSGWVPCSGERHV